jgi:plastocyanin
MAAPLHLKKTIHLYKYRKKKPAPSLYIVQIEQMKFFPPDISVNAGDTIMWVNNDMVAHDITEEKNKSWSSSLLQAGEVVEASG